MSIGKYYYGARFVTNGGDNTEYVMGDGTLNNGSGINTTIGTDDDLTTSGALVVNAINLTNGVVTAHSTRTLTLAQLGYTGDANANEYVLPFTDNSADWNTAYGWGDHSLAGYTGDQDLSGYLLNTTDTFTGALTVNGDIRGSGQQLILNAGEAYAYATGQTGEHVYINSEQGLEVNSETNNWQGNGWADRKTALLRGDLLRLDGESLTKTNIQNFKAAYLWGDHSVEGYLTSADISASNGLTETGGDIELGGSLSSATLINTASDSLSIYNSSSGGLIQAKGSAAHASGFGSAVFGFGDSSGFLEEGFNAFSDKFEFVSDSGKGIEYDADYSATYTTRSLVDKGYVDANGYILPFTDNSANWNTAYSWGDHALAGYNTTIGTDTDINTSGFNVIDNIYMTDGVITSTGSRALLNLSIEDTRAAEKTPNDYLSKALSLDFTDEFGSLGSWWSGITVKGWENNYQAWQLIGGSGTGANTSLYFRQGVGTSWGAMNEIWHSGSDGAGSGLDADKLDGQEGIYYLNYNNFTNTPTIPTARTDEEIRDVAAAQWIDGTNTTVVVNDSANTIKINATGGGSSLWSSDTNGITYTAGNVGIGGASQSGFDLRVVGQSRFNDDVRFDGDVSVAGGNLVVNNSLLDVNTVAGTAGQILSSEGPGGGVEWIDAPSGGGGGVTAVSAGDGLTGGGIGGSVTLDVNAGTGLSISSDKVIVNPGDGLTTTSTQVTVDNTVVRTSGNQTISGTKAFTGTINLDGNGGSGGVIKDYSGSTGAFNQVLTSRANGGVEWKTASTGGSSVWSQATGLVYINDTANPDKVGINTSSPDGWLEVSKKTASGTTPTLLLTQSDITYNSSNDNFLTFKSKRTSVSTVYWNVGHDVGGNKFVINYSTTTSPFAPTGSNFVLDINGNLSLEGNATATNFILSSDRRLKENIKDVDYDQHIKADWKTFNLKKDDEEKRYGVIAQELEVNHPEFVNTDEEGYKSVKYIDLLIAKIAELEARLEKLEK